MNHSLRCKTESYPESSNEKGIRIKDKNGHFLGEIIKENSIYKIYIYSKNSKELCLLPLYAFHGILKEVTVKEGERINTVDIVF